MKAIGLHMAVVVTVFSVSWLMNGLPGALMSVGLLYIALTVYSVRAARAARVARLNAYAVHAALATARMPHPADPPRAELVD